jgi:hypothetical protein
LHKNGLKVLLRCPLLHPNASEIIDFPFPQDLTAKHAMEKAKNYSI